MTRIISVELDEREAAHLEQIAHEEGFSTSSEYLQSLIRALAADDVDERDLRESIKQGLREALRGESVPLDQLWADDDE